ncbi:MAG: hypothetical protein ACQGVK_15345 [Myxococcota bacterium]
MQTWVIGTVLLSALVGTWVGVKLLGLAVRTREWPELAIGVGLLCYGTVAQVLRVVTLSLPEDADPALRVVLVGVRMLAFAGTLAGLGIFTWRVFGADSVWRRNLAVGLAVTGAACAVRIAYGFGVQTFGGPPTPAPWNTSLAVAFLVTFTWTSTEALRYHGLMRRRLALGLADPVIVNRFLVWGAGAGLSTGLTLVPVLSAMAGRVDDPIAGVATAAAGLLNALVWLLSFTPPAAYLRWLESRHAAAPST